MDRFYWKRLGCHAASALLHQSCRALYGAKPTAVTLAPLRPKMACSWFRCLEKKRMLVIGMQNKLFWSVFWPFLEKKQILCQGTIFGYSQQSRYAQEIFLSGFGGSLLLLLWFIDECQPAHAIYSGRVPEFQVYPLSDLKNRRSYIIGLPQISFRACLQSNFSRSIFGG